LTAIGVDRKARSARC